MGTGVVSPLALAYVEDNNDFYHLNMEQDFGRRLDAGRSALGSDRGRCAFHRLRRGIPQGSRGRHRRSYGAAGGLGGGNFNPIRGQYNVIEGFAELDIPIIKNGIVESLDGNMAGRMTSYSTCGLVETWKLGLTSQINDDVRLRFTMSYDIRAPNLGELYNDIPGLGRPDRLQDQQHRQPRRSRRPPATSTCCRNRRPPIRAVSS